MRELHTFDAIQMKFIRDINGVKRGQLSELRLDFTTIGEREKQREYLPDWVADITREHLGGDLPGDLYVCNWTGLTGLRGAPKHITGWLDCSRTSCGNPYNGGNGLEAEEIEYVGGLFRCREMIHMHTLQGLPKRIVEGIDCSGSTQLGGFGKDVPNTMNEFICSDCPLLKSLENCPKEVNWFDCTGCPNLKFDPEHHPWNAKEFECDKDYRTELQLHVTLQGMEQTIGKGNVAQLRDAFSGL